MYKYLPIIIITAIVNYSCSQQAKSREFIPRDTTITDENAFSPLRFDSSRLEEYITRTGMSDSLGTFMRNFYNNRNFHFAWISSDGLSEQTLAFWNLHNSFINYTRDSSIVDKQLHQQMDQLISEDSSFIVDSVANLQLELQITGHFYEYAHYAYGGRIDPWELQWHIPRKKINAMALLDTIISHEGKNIEELEPLNVSYRALKKELLRYYDIEKEGGWEILDMNRKKYSMHDTGSFIPKIKLRLMKTGDLPNIDTSDLFNTNLVEAVKAVQRRYGLKADGVIRNNLVQNLNIPVKNRIEQMLINLERMRWLPKEPHGNRIVANIPEYKLHIFKDGEQVFDMNIVVGQEGHRTVVFTDKLEYIVFSPYWNVPRSIVRNEILPALNRDPNYLHRNNMERTGFSNGLPVIRQKPGGKNALGRVKFIFPNSYSIYFHDTPAKSLFNKQKRAFSHGCVRLSEPRKLAEYLLRDNKYWTSGNIQKAMYSGKEKWVKLEEPIPVALFYFTAWVDNEGALNFREDIYGRDKKMADRLFAK